MSHGLKLVNTTLENMIKPEKNYNDNQHYYDLLFSPELNRVSTTHGYIKILERIPDNSLVYDVGIGAGIYLTNKSIIDKIKQKNLNIIGIDLDSNAIRLCNSRIQEVGLTKYVSAKCKDFMLCVAQKTEQNIVTIFCESFPLMDDKTLSKLVSHAIDIGSSKIISYQNLEENSKNFRKYGKNIISSLSGCDFGRVLNLTLLENNTKPYKPIIVETISIKPSEFPITILFKKACSLNLIWWWLTVIFLSVLKLLGIIFHPLNNLLETKQCVVEWNNTNIQLKM